MYTPISLNQPSVTVSTNDNQRRLSVAVAVFVVLVLNVEGFAKFLFLPELVSGQLSPYLSPIVLFVLASTAAIGSLRSMVNQKSLRVHPFILVSIAGTVVLGFFGSQNGDSTKLLRDLIYLWSMTFAFLTIERFDLTSKVDFTLVAKVVALLMIIVLPAFAFALDTSSQLGRFSGFMISSPLFGIAIFISYALALMSHRVQPWQIDKGLLSVTWIFMSGTRTALILLVLLLAHVIVFDFDKRKPNYLAIGAFLLLILLGAQIGWSEISNQPWLIDAPRLLSFSDVEFGSLNTRGVWYALLFNILMRDGSLGGFGAGAAETTVGFIPHFDLLRYWFDYSIIYALVFLWMVLEISLSVARKRKVAWHSISNLCYILFLLMSLMMVSMHNVFQSPSCLLFFTLMSYMAYKGFGKTSARENSSSNAG